jgi:predicted outer membrane repeat protein
VDSTATIEGFTLTGGSAQAGGGMSHQWSSATVIRCTFIGNWAHNGGGMSLLIRSLPTLFQCTFIDNYADFDGGGLYCAPTTHTTLNECHFSGNSARYRGGGMYCWRGPRAVLNDCTFVDNTAAQGGGLRCWIASPTLSHCRFIGNTAEKGGGIFFEAGTYPIDISHCTFYHNASDSGAALFCKFGVPVTVSNSILAFSTYGVGVLCDSVTVPAFSCTDVYGNAAGDWVGYVADQYGVDGNICADPLFCNPEIGDFSISAYSPCEPGHSGCGLMGADSVGCFLTPVAESAADPPAAFHLGLPLPNPFNPFTEIRYAIPPGATRSDVSLDVYDVGGRHVKTLVDREDGPGTYRVRWDGTDHAGAVIASGVYFLRMTCDGRSETRRMVLLR